MRNEENLIVIETNNLEAEESKHSGGPPSPTNYDSYNPYSNNNNGLRRAPQPLTAVEISQNEMLMPYTE